MTPKHALEKLLRCVIVVTEKPDDGQGANWWVGIDTCLVSKDGRGHGFWDTSCLDKEHAELVAQNVRKDIVDSFATMIRSK